MVTVQLTNEQLFDLVQAVALAQGLVEQVNKQNPIGAQELPTQGSVDGLFKHLCAANPSAIGNLFSYEYFLMGLGADVMAEYIVELTAKSEQGVALFYREIGL